jgi:hypothetical protein
LTQLDHAESVSSLSVCVSDLSQAVFFASDQWDASGFSLWRAYFAILVLLRGWMAAIEALFKRGPQEMGRVPEEVL